MTQPTLGRQVDALEKEIGVVLFERTGRKLMLTPNGVELLDHVRAMGEAATRVSLAASGKSQLIEGPICITASEIYSAFLLPPIIARLRRAHPGIMVEIVASNTPTDLTRREADIAIRNFSSTQPDLIVKKVKDDTARPYATEAYLSAIGNPASLEELAGADFVGFANTDVLIKGLRPFGLTLSKRNFPIVTNSHLVQWEFVKHGMGIGFVTEAVGDAEPAVRRALPNAEPIVFAMWLAAHRELHTSKRVRVVYDFLAAELSGR